MAGIVTSIIQNSLSGLVEGAVTTAGGFAGNAVSGVGDLIEAKGKAVGDGVEAKINGYSVGFTNYGEAVKAATAPNPGYKSLPSSSLKSTPSTVSKKALPAPKEQKLLMPPPSKGAKSTISTPKGTYDKSVAPYKSAVGKSTYVPSSAPSTIKPKSNYAASKISTVAPSKKSPSTANGALYRSNTNAQGKVVISKASLPNKKPTPASVSGYKGPIAAPGGSVVSRPGGATKARTGPTAVAGARSTVGATGGKTGYQGPLALGSALGAPKPSYGQSTAGAPRKAPSIAGSVAKPKAAGYGGPLSLGGIA